MLNNEASAATPILLSSPSARTANFGSSYVDISEYEGDLLITLVVGSVSGTSPTMSAAIRTADDDAGTGVATFDTFSTKTTPTQVDKMVVPCNAVKRWLQVNVAIGGTTPSFNMCLVVHGRKKIV
jgi:hypothetical protein